MGSSRLIWKERTPEDQERITIQRLEKLAQEWPSHLWLFSASGVLCLMGKDEKGERVYDSEGEGGGPDRDSIITSFMGIENDGGDF